MSIFTVEKQLNSGQKSHKGQNRTEAGHWQQMDGVMDGGEGGIDSSGAAFTALTPTGRSA